MLVRVDKRNRARRGAFAGGAIEVKVGCQVSGRISCCPLSGVSG